MPTRLLALLVSSSLVVALVCCLPGCTKPASRIDNIVFISLDTLRADHVGAYGYDRPTTPNIDALAARGILFENAMSQSSWTTPAHASFFTGLLSSAHGAAKLNQPIHDDVPMLAEYLNTAGLATGAFVTHVFVGDHLGFARGFDTFWYQQSERADTPIDAALEWIETRRDQRFFAFVHLFDPHLPYDPVAEYVAEYDDFCRDEQGGFRTIRKLLTAEPGSFKKVLSCLVRRYDDEVRYADAQIGRLIAHLDQLGLRDNTLIVFLSDHGEEFLEHGGLLHGVTLYQEQIHVPLIIAGGPESIVPRGLRVPSRVAAFDIMPTLLDLLNIEPTRPMQAVSLRPLFSGQPAPDRDVSAETNDVGPDRMALLSGHHKFIYAPDAHMFLRKLAPEFFDIAADPGEHENLIDRDPETAARVRDTMIETAHYRWRKTWRLVWGGSGTERPVRASLTTTDRFTAAFKYLGVSRFEKPTPDAPIDKNFLLADYTLKRSGERILVDAKDRNVTNGTTIVAEPDDADVELTVQWTAKDNQETQKTVVLKGEIPADQPLVLADGLLKVFSETILTFPEPPPMLGINQQEKLLPDLQKKLRALGYF